MNTTKGFAPIVKFPNGAITLLLAAAGRSRSDVKRRLWFFNRKREAVEVLEVVPVAVVRREFPEPCRVAPPRGSIYWYADPVCRVIGVGDHWEGDAMDMLLLERGLVHLTLEAAQAHAETLLSLSK